MSHRLAVVALLTAFPLVVAGCTVNVNVPTSVPAPPAPSVEPASETNGQGPPSSPQGGSAASDPGAGTLAADTPAAGKVQLSATTTSRDAAPGASPTYVISVRNLADRQDSIDLEAAGDPSDWAVRLNPSQLTLASGSSGSILLTVVVPSTAAGGIRHVTTLSAGGLLGGARQTLALTTNVADIVQASFAAKAVDMPGGDTDTTDDAIELTYTSGTSDLSVTDVEMFIDGDSLTWLTASSVFSQGAYAAGELCGSSPGEVAPATADTTWERGAFMWIVDTHATTGTVADCNGAPTQAQLADLDGIHQVKVIVRGQVVLDTTIEVHDNIVNN